jgi:hypothetical protein
MKMSDGNGQTFDMYIIGHFRHNLVIGAEL